VSRHLSQQGPLRVFLICPDTRLREMITALFPETASLEPRAGELNAVLSPVVDRYPPGMELARALRTYSPHVVMVSFEQPDMAVAVIQFLESEADGLPVVALSAHEETRVMTMAAHAGVRDFLSPPFSVPQVAETLEAVRGALRRAPLSYAATEHIYSFLPAKPGVGTTTVAMNVSAAFALESRQKVLLTDLDLTCGMVRFLWKLPQDLSIVDALARAAEMDVSLWPRLVRRRDGVDILHSGGINPQAFLDATQVQGLIDFARMNYNALFFDMSGNMERHSLHVMQESKRVFVVCNPEPASLFLAREKVAFLTQLGLGGGSRRSSTGAIRRWRYRRRGLSRC
jgi:pilus assembly protein CpaE